MKAMYFVTPIKQRFGILDLDNQLINICKN